MADLPDNPNATGEKAWWPGDRERAELNDEMSERPWVKDDRLTVRPAGVRKQDSR